MVAAAKAHGVEIPEGKEKTWGNALYECFDQKVEAPELILSYVEY